MAFFAAGGEEEDRRGEAVGLLDKAFATGRLGGETEEGSVGMVTG
jgi:hypothetical protein